MSVRDVVNKLGIFMQFSAFMQIQEWIARSNSFIFYYLPSSDLIIREVLHFGYFI